MLGSMAQPPLAVPEENRSELPTDNILKNEICFPLSLISEQGQIARIGNCLKPYSCGIKFGVLSLSLSEQGQIVRIGNCLKS